MRKANEIDFWRGYALVSIFANHIPGFFFERFTHRNFGLSDSAELFVFLAGWSVRLLGSSPDGASLPRFMLRLASRAVTRRPDPDHGWHCHGRPCGASLWRCGTWVDGMAVGIARAAQTALWGALCVALTCEGARRPASAQEGAPPTLSASCQAPSSDIATPVPLPRLAAKLEAKEPIKVLAIGSSSTVGVGATSPINNYPARLRRILERTFQGLNVAITNRGVSGELAATTAARLRMQIAVERPDLILWQVGTNDALMRVPADEFAATVRETLGWLKENEIDVVLVGLQYTPRASKDEHYASVRKALREIAAEESVPFVRRFEAMQFIQATRDANLVSGDGLHLNDMGYGCMAEHIAHAIVVSAFMRPSPTLRKK